MSGSETATPPGTALEVIVLGAPRSGTYWLVDILDRYFDIRIPTETHFIPVFGRRIGLWGDLSKRRNRERLLRNIYEYLSLWTVRSSDAPDYLAQVRDVSLLVTLDRGRAGAILDASHDYPSLIAALYGEFARIHDAAASGDKSAYYSAIDPARTLDHTPGTRAIHIIRDGRDVALSWMKTWFGPPTVRDAAREWRGHVECYRHWSAEHPGAGLELRYEDLARDEAGEVDRIGAFLGREPIRDGTRTSAISAALSSTDSHSAIQDMDARSNIEKWRTQMAADDVAAFDAIAGDTLRRCGYDAALAGDDGSARTLMRPLSRHKLRVGLKNLLPVCLYLAGRTGFPALAVLNRGQDAVWRSVRM